MWLSDAANATVRLFLAPVCLCCRTPLEAPLRSPACPACWKAIAAITPPCCAICGDALPAFAADGRLCARCDADPPPFSRARSAGRYDGPLRALIHALKYRHCRPLAAPLAALAVRAGGDVLAGADAVVPVPLHPWRAVTRGFNQADDLARGMGLPVWRVLRRTRGGPAQVTLSAADRHANVQGAFALTRRTGASARARRRLARATVVVVDDVMTTGATIAACCRVLADAGVSDVRALTVARAPMPPHASRPWPRRRAPPSRR
jgi:ComF family protein